MSSSSRHVYPLGHAERELERLTLQARLFEPPTRRLFEAAGLTSGMRVLDVGSGSGDVAFLARDIVGPSGFVLGFDRAPEAIATATARAQAHGFDNVRFVEADLAVTDHRGHLPSFDAIVGRLVLMHQPDPAGVVRRVAAHVRPGGLIVFLEFDTHISRSVPPTSTFDKTLDLINRTLEAAGSDNVAGLKLAATFKAAGLPAPEFRYEAIVAGEPGHPLYQVVAGIARTVAPLMERFGTAAPADLNFDTLAARMEAEVDAAGGVIVSPALVGAWTRTRDTPADA